jgi:aryl-alcohol dehydrogenase-like predicted oxidoreductase
MTIATKVGKPMGEDKRGLSKAYITKAVEDSLTRLQTDYIDIYFAHFDDNQILLTETLECFTELIKQGKVRAIGASNYTADRLRKSLNVSSKSGLARYECLQPEYNLYDREGYENGLEEICVKNNIGVISYYGLASGFLTGKYRSEDDLTKSNRGKGIRKYLNDRGHRILKVLDELSKEYNTTPAAIALAWVIARPSITAPIASATSVEQLNEITKAVDLKLGQVAISMLNRASSY